MKKSHCPKCKREIDSKYDFCPYCGSPLDNKNDWGMLGKNDAPEFSEFSLPGLFNENIIGKMLGSAMKMLEREMQKEMKNNFESPKSNFQLFVNGKKIPIGEKNKEQRKKRIQNSSPVQIINQFSQEEQKKFLSLPRFEPQTNVRRLSDRIIYEIKIPGIKSQKEISIKRLENSIEIKALVNNKAYYKIIKVGFPIINYYLDKEKLILELGIK
ncbi:hypothetical protein DRN73_01660 [Candidatus Pacearchaeota archaeon]|nr:MAG: hypothetical protein DRN73_01660 [Candidatus Pacearchaeota archaeon]